MTALRWARFIRELGHTVRVETSYDGRPCDLLVALHAKRSSAAVFDFNADYPGRPAVVALTGTDVYRDIHRSAAARRALEAASRLIALQPLAVKELAPHLRDKVRVIYQSVTPGRGSVRRRRSQACVVGHLRSIKDPFRAAMAVRGLPCDSRIEVVQAGAALEDRMAPLARLEEARNPRYRWLGKLSAARVRRLIAGSGMLVLSSKMEGGANVISEAIVEGTPVLASRIPGSIGLLGADYPGFFDTGDTHGLRALLLRAENDDRFYRELTGRCARLAKLFDPRRELTAWRRLLSDLL